MNIQEYSKSIIEQINQGIKWTWYNVYGNIKIQYKDWDNLVEFEITNQY